MTTNKTRRGELMKMDEYALSRLLSDLGEGSVDMTVAQLINRILILEGVDLMIIYIAKLEDGRKIEFKSRNAKAAAYRAHRIGVEKGSKMVSWY